MSLLRLQQGGARKRCKYPLAQSGDLAGTQLGVLQLEATLKHPHVLAVPVEPDRAMGGEHVASRHTVHRARVVVAREAYLAGDLAGVSAFLATASFLGVSFFLAGEAAASLVGVVGVDFASAPATHVAHIVY